MHHFIQHPAVRFTGKTPTLRRHAENLAAALIWTFMAAIAAIYPAAVGYWIGAGA